MSTRSITRSLVAALTVVMLLAAGCGDDDTASADETTQSDDTTTTETASETTEAEATETTGAESTETTEAEATVPSFDGELLGLFAADPAECSVAGEESGSFFRMVQAGGTLEEGPYIPNGDSTCADQTFTPLAPGTEGGLLTGVLQPGAEPLFDEAGNATSDRIVQPTTFFGVAFAMATTDEADPPSIVAADGALSGDIAAAAAYYATETFNQGSPKPDGSAPGLTTPGPSGTIDAETGAYELDCVSQIVGGAFNDFSGVWHLEGTFTPED